MYGVLAQPVLLFDTALTVVSCPRRLERQLDGDRAPCGPVVSDGGDAAYSCPLDGPCSVASKSSPAHGTLSDWPNSASPVASPSTCVVTPVRTLQSPRPIDPHDYDCGHWPLTRPTYGSILQCTKSPSAQSAAGRPTRRLAKVDQVP
ncbi:hypothetical protein ACCO45_008520 [Purpureocillium lilacinum]|uniref:Uncharacterized protein n=1 Tax=Purpureocillium lilacinum TaxID=33203 RepID=A0ACC4DPA1_PURLI